MIAENTFATAGQYMQKWRLAAILLISYVVVYELSSIFLPASAQLHPATSLALAALFFGDVWLWPAVYLIALLSAALSGMPALTLLIAPVIVTLQSVVGAYLLRKGKVDPLFRRHRDMFYLISIVLLISLLSPTLETLGARFHGTAGGLELWGQAYAAAIFCFLIITPFILRWFTKPRLKRTPLEVLETAAVFAVLLGLDFTEFVLNIPSIFGVPTIYLVLIPLFLISLRLRPRFVTLALVITSMFGIFNVLTNASAGDLSLRLFQIESLFIVLAVIFYIIVSLEEDRRVNTNLMHSQLATLKNAMERIRMESNAKNDFIAVLGHELRNPLAPVVSAIDTMRLEPQNAEDAATLDMMADRMNTVRRLLDDLLDISRISEGKIALKLESIDLQEILNRAVLSTDHHRKEQHQSLVFRTPGKPIFITADPVRLEQVFSNLLTNASKYSGAGDTVTLTVEEQDRMVEIQVIDQGVGIHNESLEAIFLPFQQLEQDKRMQSGLGIGLSLVRTFVEMHRGSVVAVSKGPGAGSRFIVRLPLSFSPPRATRDRRELLESPASRGKAHLRVLVVDDNDAAAGGIGRLLEMQGCSVDYAYTGQQAIEKAENFLPDLILLDVGLPDQDGYTVARALRDRGFTGCIIALTGYSSDEAKELAKEAGFDDHLVKPAGLTDLKRLLSQLT